MFDGLYFEYPKAISFVVIYIACEAYCKIRSRAIYFPHVNQLTKETEQLSSLMWFLKWLGILFLVLSLMSPVRDEKLLLKPISGPSIVFVIQDAAIWQETGIDTSNPSLTNYDILKRWLNRWMKKHPHSSYGIVVATDKSYIASPLSRSTNALQSIINNLSLNHTNAEVNRDVVLEEVKRVFEYTDTQQKIVVMISNKDSSILQRKRYIKEGFKLYRMIMVSKDSEKVELDMQKVGHDKDYVVSTSEELENVYQTINMRERLQVEEYDYTFKTYYYFYPLFLSFFTLLVYVYLRNRRGHA